MTKTSTLQRSSISSVLSPVLITSLITYIASIIFTRFYAANFSFHLWFSLLSVFFTLCFSGFILKNVRKGNYSLWYLAITFAFMGTVGFMPYDVWESGKVNAAYIFPVIMIVYCGILGKLSKSKPLAAVAGALALCVAFFVFFCFFTYTAAAILTAIILPVLIFAAIGRKLFRCDWFYTVILVVLWVFSAIFFLSICKPFINRHFLCYQDVNGIAWRGTFARDMIKSSVLFGPGTTLDESHTLTAAVSRNFSRNCDTQLALLSYEHGLVAFILSYLLPISVVISIIISASKNHRPRSKAHILPDLIITGTVIYFIIRIVFSLLMNLGIVFNFDFCLPFISTNASARLIDVLLIGMVCACLENKAECTVKFDRIVAERNSPAGQANLLNDRADELLVLSKTFTAKADYFSEMSMKMQKQAKQLENSAIVLTNEANNLLSSAAPNETTLPNDALAREYTLIYGTDSDLENTTDDYDDIFISDDSNASIVSDVLSDNPLDSSSEPDGEPDSLSEARSSLDAAVAELSAEITSLGGTVSSTAADADTTVSDSADSDAE